MRIFTEMSLMSDLKPRLRGLQVLKNPRLRGLQELTQVLRLN